MTPWGPIVLVAFIAVGGALLITRLTGRSGYGWSYATFVLAVASAVFGMIATIAFVWAGLLMVMSIAIFVGTERAPTAS